MEENDSVDNTNQNTIQIDCENGIALIYAIYGGGVCVAYQWRTIEIEI